MIGIDVPEFNRDQQRFRGRMLTLVRAVRQQAITEVRRHTVRMRSLAKSNAPKASGTLRSSIVETYAREGLEGVVSMNRPDHYGQWVEGIHHNYALGRAPGRAPPYEPIRRWVELRGLARKWDMSEKSATFLVRRKIARKGTPAQPYMKPGFEVVGPEFDRAMAAVFNRAAQNVVKLL